MLKLRHINFFIYNFIILKWHCHGLLVDCVSTYLKIVFFQSRLFPNCITLKAFTQWVSTCMWLSILCLITPRKQSSTATSACYLSLFHNKFEVNCLNQKQGLHCRNNQNKSMFKILFVTARVLSLGLGIYSCTYSPI